MRVLLTRPRAQAEESAERLRAAGHSVIIAPILEIHPVPGATISLEGVQALVVTSANGAHYGFARLAGGDPPVFCVGERTAEAARRAGIEAPHSAAGDAEALADAIAERLVPEDGALLHLCGRDRKARLKDRLERAGFALREEVVYEARQSGDMPEAANRALEEGDIDLVLLYSARSARCFRALAEPRFTTALAGCAAAAMSSRVAGEIKDVFGCVYVADSPNEPGMLRAVERAARGERYGK